ncbi:MAG: hypothetical protein N2490_05400 [Ignavibacteria bacterium]|nr:hypothetical protein [Ignavibacteria bacterium]
MESSTRKQLLILILICTLSHLFYQIVRTYIYKIPFGLPLDDTYIHLQYANNFAKGYFFQFNIGEYTPGTTSAVYIIILGILFLIFENQILISVILSSLFHIASVIVTLFLSKLYLSELIKKYPILSNYKYLEIIPSIILIFIGRYNWSAQSGMETTLFVFLILTGIYFHSKEIITKKQNLTPAIIFALASLTRPEGYLISALYFIDKIIFLLHYDRSNKYKYLLLEIVIFILIILPYPLFSLITTSSLFPTSYKAINIKHTENQNIRFLIIFLTYLFRDIPVLAIIFVFNIIIFLKNIKKYFSDLSFLRLLNFSVIVFPLAFTIGFPIWRNHGRYMIPYIILIAINSFFSLLIYLQKLNNKKYFPKIVLALSIIILISSLPYYLVFAKHLSKNIDNINSMQCKAGIWIRDNLDKDTTVATNDIGAIAYYSNHRILDLEGLVTPEVLRFRNYSTEQRNDSLFNFCIMKKINYMLIFDNWYPGMTEKYSNKVNLVKIFPVSENTICGDDTLKVYKIIY